MEVFLEGIQRRTQEICLNHYHCLLHRLSPKAEWGLGNTRARETSEKRERGMMGTSVGRERGVLGRKRRERGFFSPSHLSLRPRFP